MKWWYFCLSLVALVLAATAFKFTIDINKAFTTYNGMRNMLDNSFEFDLSGKIEPLWIGTFSSNKDIILVMIFDSVLIVFGISSIGFAIYGIIDDEMVAVAFGFSFGFILLIFAGSQLGIITKLYLIIKNAQFTFSLENNIWYWTGMINNQFFYDNVRDVYLLNTKSFLTQLSRAQLGVGIVAYIGGMASPIATIWIDY
jgi:hypothetical protein